MGSQTTWIRSDFLDEEEKKGQFDSIRFNSTQFDIVVFLSYLGPPATFPESALETPRRPIPHIFQWMWLQRR